MAASKKIDELYDLLKASRRRVHHSPAHGPRLPADGYAGSIESTDLWFFTNAETHKLETSGGSRT